jgi:hypothetical protein
MICALRLILKEVFFFKLMICGLDAGGLGWNGRDGDQLHAIS